MFIKVDLPDPDGPMIATSSLRPIVRSTPLKARTVSPPIGYSLVIASRRMTAEARSSWADVDFESKDPPSPKPVGLGPSVVPREPRPRCQFQVGAGSAGRVEA